MSRRHDNDSRPRDAHADTTATRASGDKRSDEGRPRDGGHPDAEPTLGADASGGEAVGQGPETELEILRGELTALQARLSEAERAAREHEERMLRARAELDTVRRRVDGERQRAHHEGQDGALAPALSVYDDLRRALQAARTSDPEDLIPGIEAVLQGLERSLDRLGIRTIGEVGEPFDPDLHEALTTTPVSEDAEAGTIANVFEAGFVQGDRLIRPARVVVHQDD